MMAPHDRFFRYLFNSPARAAALLRHNLPAKLVAKLDWSTLRRESGTLVDWQRETRQDLLFSVRYRGSAADDPPHYFIIEHQSSVPRLMAVRLHDYAWHLVQHWRAVNPRSKWIPQVTAVVVYPRRGRRWSAPLRLEDHYRVPGSATGKGHCLQWALRSRYRIDDLTRQSEWAVRARPGPPLVALGLLVLSYAGSPQLAQRLPHWRDLVAKVYATANGPRELARVIHYLHQLGDTQALKALRRVLNSLMKPERVEGLMRTVADILRAQGRREGRREGEAKGEAKGLAKAVLRLLAARGVRVDTPSRRRIQRCTDVSMLERWFERAMGANRLSEVWGEN